LVYIKKAILISMSTSKPPLTPTVITDRNGRVTTVHKKESRIATSKRQLPAPDLGMDGRSSSLERLMALADRHAALKGITRDKDQMAKLHDLLADPATGRADVRWQALIGRFDDIQTKAVITALESKEGFKPVMEEMDQRFSAGQIAGFAAVYDPDIFAPSELSDAPEHDKVQISIERYSKAYHHLRRSELLGGEYDSYGDMAKNDPEKLRVVESYYRLYSALNDAGHLGMVPKELVEYATSGEQNIHDVASAIRDTGSNDLTVIRGVLEGVAAPVAEGWL
jgi:hypothetical protein